MRVELADAEPNGLASMLAGLIEANLARHPSRRALLRHPAVIELSAPDAGVAVTLELSASRIAVANGHASESRRHLHVRADAHDLLVLSAVPLRFGLPDPLTREGRAVLGKVVRGRIRIEGLLRHPARLSRLSRLLSVV